MGTGPARRARREGKALAGPFPWAYGPARHHATSTDPGVRAFREAIAYYAEDLDRVETGGPAGPGAADGTPG